MLKFKTFLIPITKPKIKTDADTHPTVFFKNSETLKKKKNLNWSTSQSNSKIFSKSKNSLSLQCFNKALKMWRWAMYMVYTVGFLKINLWTANFFHFALGLVWAQNIWILSQPQCYWILFHFFGQSVFPWHRALQNCMTCVSEFRGMHVSISVRMCTRKQF